MSSLQHKSMRGESIIEFAIVLPVLLGFLIGIMDIGRVIWAQATLDRAVETAARCGAIDANNCPTLAAVQTYAASHSYGLTVPVTDFVATTAACGVNVVASYPFTFYIPGITPGALTLSATSCYPT